MKIKVKTEGLYERCFAASPHKDVIRNSHLPFEDGFYVTENEVLLKVSHSVIYKLTENGWEKHQQYFSLWYDVMEDFADIAPEIIHELRLEETGIVRDNSLQTD